MYQETNFNNLKSLVLKFPFQCRFLAYKLEKELIENLEKIESNTYICKTNESEYKIVFSDLDILDIDITKI